MNIKKDGRGGIGIMSEMIGGLGEFGNEGGGLWVVCK